VRRTVRIGTESQSGLKVRLGVESQTGKDSQTVVESQTGQKARLDGVRLRHKVECAVIT
jgi:hypothetical protein